MMANYFSIFQQWRMVLELATKSQMNANLIDTRECIVEFEKETGKEIKSGFEFRRINQIEVKETLYKINASNSKGPNRLSPKMQIPVDHLICISISCWGKTNFLKYVNRQTDFEKFISNYNIRNILTPFYPTKTTQ